MRQPIAYGRKADQMTPPAGLPFFARVII